MVAATILLGALPLAIAHGEGHDGATMDKHDPPAPVEHDGAPSSYWSLPDHASMMYWHIALELLAWAVVLPVGALGLQSFVSIGANLFQV